MFRYDEQCTVLDVVFMFRWDVQCAVLDVMFNVCFQMWYTMSFPMWCTVYISKSMHCVCSSEGVQTTHVQICTLCFPVKVYKQLCVFSGVMYNLCFQIKFFFFFRCGI